MAYAQNGSSGEITSASDHHMNQDIGDAPWAPRLGSSFPYFSRAFDLYMSKDPLLPAGPVSYEEVRLASTSPISNVSSTGFLSPSYLRGTVYLQKLEEKHRARVAADQEGALSNGTVPASSAVSAGLQSNGIALGLPVVGAKVTGSTHRGVAFDVVEKSASQAEEDDMFSPLPSRWNKDDKEAALEILGDGYEVRYTGKPGSEHEASAVRADHYMSPACGVYYFEITILNSKMDKVKYVDGCVSGS